VWPGFFGKKWIIPNGSKIFQMVQYFPFQGPPKFTQIRIFGLKINHLATLFRSPPFPSKRAVATLWSQSTFFCFWKQSDKMQIVSTCSQTRTKSFDRKNVEWGKFKILAPKLSKKWSFFLFKPLIILQKLDHNIAVWETRQFFLENCRKSQKIMIITLTPGLQREQLQSSKYVFKSFPIWFTHMCLIRLFWTGPRQ
jgi:hypothetical protein